jgi:AraC-like DNA-binding protein
MKSKLHRIKDWPERARISGFSASKLAKLCGVSQRSLERFFKETKAVSPHQWLHLQRLLQAKSVLLESPSIKEAADALGYKQPSHFSREFKRHHGASPSGFLEASMPSSSLPPASDQVSRLDK